MLNNHSILIAKNIAKQSKVSLESGHNVFTDSIRYSMPLLALKSVSIEDAAGHVRDAADVMIESEGINVHEGAVGNAVEILVEGITNQFNYVRNVVRPFISKANDRLLTRLKSSTPAEYKISEFSISPFLLSDTAKSVFLANAPVNYYKVPTGGTPRNSTQIIQDISTNISEIDSAIGQIIANVGDKAVEDIFCAIFCDTRPDDKTRVADLVRKLTIQTPNGKTVGAFVVEEVDFLLLAYFIAEGYLENPIDGTGLSLDEYTTYVRQVMANIGGRIRLLTDAYAKDVNDGVLYLRYPSASGLFFDDSLGEILLLKETYRKAIEMGISAEMIIGGAIHPKAKLRRLAELPPKKEELIQVYNAMDKNRQRLVAFDISERVNSSMRIVLTSCLDEEPDDVFPTDFNKTNALANIDQVTDRLKSYFAAWDMSEKIDIYNLMIDVICNVVFPFTDAKAVFDAMSEMQAKEDLQPREIAYYAEVLYLARWMVANFHISKDDE